MEFRLLGLLTVADGTGPLDLPRGKESALLAILLLHANEPVSVDRLAEQLWPAEAPANVPKTIQIYVSRLRKRLGRDRITTTSAGYRVRAASSELDVEQFRGLAADGRAALAQGDATSARRLLAQALGLWHGEALADFRFEAFAQAEIRRLDGLRAETAANLIDARLEDGDTEGIVAEIEALVATNPVWDRPRAQLMLALYRAGRQAEALAAYRDARGALVDELGIEPPRSLRDLEQAILRHDPALEAADRADGEESDLVGRLHEQAVITEAIGEAARGRGGIVLVSGEPGIGKTTLLEMASRYGRARGFEVLPGRAWEAGGAPPYWPWVEALQTDRRAAGAELEHTDLVKPLATIVDYLTELQPSGRDAELAHIDDDGARFRLFTAVSGLLGRAGERRPILLLLDDLHAADTPSLLLLQFIGRHVARSRVLVLGAFRDASPAASEQLAATLTELVREGTTRRIRLARLDDDDVALYVRRALPDEGSELAAAVSSQTEGNPLFLREIVRLLRDTGQLAIPDTVRDVIRLRLNGLSPRAADVLEVASVLGREFPLALLPRLVLVDEDAVDAALAEANGAGIVAPVPGSRGRFRFTHILVRDTVYDGLLASRRKQLHAGVLAVLEDLHALDPEPFLAELAHHAAGAGDAARSSGYARRAGDRALSTLAYEEAARLYSLSLDDTRDPVDRYRLLFALGTAHRRSGNAGAAKAAFHAAADVGGRLGEPRLVAQAAAAYAGDWMNSRAGADPQLVPLLEQALGSLPADETFLRSRLMARLAGALRDEPGRDRRDRLSRVAVELARATGDDRALAFALDGRLAAIAAPDTIDEQKLVGDELLTAAARSGDPERLLHGHFQRLFADVLTGDLANAAKHLTAAGAIAARFRTPTDLWQIAATGSMFALAQGRLVDAQTLTREAETHGRDAQPDMAIPVHRLQQYTLAEILDTYDGLQDLVDDLADAYPARPVFRCVRVHLRTRLGQTREAADELDRLAHGSFTDLPFDVEWLYAMSLLSDAATELRRLDAASDAYDLLLPWSELNAADPPEAIRGAVSRYLGRLAHALGRHDAAETHLQRALTLNTAMGARPWLALTQEDYARLLTERGRPGDAEHARKLEANAATTLTELRATKSSAIPA